MTPFNHLCELAYNYKTYKDPNDLTTGISHPPTDFRVEYHSPGQKSVS